MARSDALGDGYAARATRYAIYRLAVGIRATVKKQSAGMELTRSGSSDTALLTPAVGLNKVEEWRSEAADQSGKLQQPRRILTSFPAPSSAPLAHSAPMQSVLPPSVFQSPQ